MDAHIHPETLEETPPLLLSNWFYLGKSFLEENGWYLLGGTLLLYYAWVKIQPYLRKWEKQRDERNYAAMCHKNPDLLITRQEAMHVARERMQAQHDLQSRVQAEKMKEREEKKREEYLASLEGKGPRRLGHRQSDESSSSVPNTGHKKPSTSSHKPDYNPLMGAGGSGGYRPPRRSCPGGGCG